MFARAREVVAAEDAEVLLCARGRRCLLEGEGELVAGAGPYSLWRSR
jgi:hypothetical protein